MRSSRSIGILVLAAAALGLIFAAYSTYDYVQHLDRQMHAVHCSFIPGAPVGGDDNACKAALFSPYSALFRGTYWGGVPISLFAVGSFCFFAAYGVYLVIARERAPRIAFGFLGIVGCGPILVSLVMFVISASKLGTFCKLCVGIYVCSFGLAVASVFALVRFVRMRTIAVDPTAPTEGAGYPIGLRTTPAAGGLLASLEQAPRSSGAGGSAVVLALGLLVAIGVTTVLPALVYVVSLPDYRPYLTKCGAVPLKAEPHNALVAIQTAHPVQKATLFEDPLCPTCKAFHQRLVADDVFDKLDVTLVLFPLDTTCNWMLDRSLHPGACLLSGVVICSGGSARSALEWAYAEQDDLREAGKLGPDVLKQRISARFGPDIAKCADDKKTTVRLNQHLHFASNNRVPISTPQMFLGDRRVCEEDTDLGLKYTLSQLAPAVLR
jgi:hypothetical protein